MIYYITNKSKKECFGMLENNTNKEFFNFEYNNFYFEPRNVEKSTIFRNLPADGSEHK